MRPDGADGFRLERDDLLRRSPFSKVRWMSIGFNGNKSLDVATILVKEMFMARGAASKGSSGAAGDEHPHHCRGRPGGEGFA